MQHRKNLRVLVARHGQSVWNGTNRISGQLDPDLSQKGLRQSRALARILRTERLDEIYTSTLRRTVTTAQPTADMHGLKIRSYEALKEIDFGELQGRYRDQRDPAAMRMWQLREQDKLHYHPPAGESFVQLENRVIACLREILAIRSQRLILIVGHRSTNRVIIGALMGWPRERWAAINPRARYLCEITQSDSPSINSIALTGETAGTRHAGYCM